MDFTAGTYRGLMRTINRAGLPVYGIADWMQQRPDRGVFVRHDVDRMPGNSLRIAQMESEAGWKTTYYFRIVKASFRPGIIRQIAALGHEIGYHYEDLSLAGGDFDKAGRLFADHLARLREHADVRTAAMHGRPLSGIDNRDLWKRYRPGEFGLIGEAFLDIDYRDAYYFTDTGRNWIMGKNNLRDTTECRPVEERVASTADLMRFMENRPGDKFALITHPERWSGNAAQWVYSWGLDQAANAVKALLKAVR